MSYETSRPRRVAVALVVAIATCLSQAAPVGARPLPGPPSIGLHARSGSNTEMVMSGTGPGRGVSGFIPDATNPFDPVLDGYPTGNPTTGFIAKDEGFAGIIFGQPTDGSATLSLYCFDLFTDTWPGIGYALGTWDAATVPNVGFVARILNEYYPFVPTEPAGLANDTERAAAVQAAIWFFSDRYVLNTSDPLHDTVAAIVAHIISEGPATSPPAPSLTITPTDASGPSPSAIVGPFTVTSGNRIGHGGRDRSRHVFGLGRHRAHRQRGTGCHSGPDLAEVDGTDRSRVAGHGQDLGPEAERLPLRRQHLGAQRRPTADAGARQ